VERVLYNRWVLTVICMITVAALSVAFMGGYLGAGISNQEEQAQQDRAAQARRDRTDAALESWQDESHLVDKTGEDPLPSPSPSLSPTAVPPPAAMAPDELEGPAAEDE